MTTWGSLRAFVRAELKDENDTKYKWSDTLLYLYLKDALADFSQYFPLPRYQVELVYDDVTPPIGYVLPSDFLKDVLVESPLGTHLIRYTKAPGKKLLEKNVPTHYRIEGKRLKLNATTDETVLLTYHALHPCPSAEDDNDFELTIDLQDEELIRLYMKAEAHGFVRGKAARLDRFKPVGTRDDNPLIPEVEFTHQDYMAKVFERLGGKTHFLRRN